jgi:hypothetical protein
MKRSSSPSVVSTNSKRGKVCTLKYEETSLADTKNLMLVLLKAPSARHVPSAMVSVMAQFLLVVIPPWLPIRASVLERRRRLTAIRDLLHGPSQALVILEERVPGCTQRMASVVERNKAILRTVTRPALMFMCAKLFLTRQDRLGLVCRHPPS